MRNNQEEPQQKKELPYLNQILKEFNTDSGDLSLNALLESFIKVCDAIAYAHSKNVLHLDLNASTLICAHKRTG